MDNITCEYGCGKDAGHQLKNNKWCCSKSPNSCEAVKIKNGKGLKKAYHENRKVSHFNNLTKKERSYNGKRGANIRDQNLGEVEFRFRSTTAIKNILFEEQDGKCNKCGLTEWLGKPIAFELEHKDGDGGNNKRENVELLCPNCHSQTTTWRGRNINSGIKKVSDEELTKAYHEQGNIRRALISVGLSPKGGNYARMNRLLK